MDRGFWAEARSRGRAFFTNWSTYDASFGTKARLFAKNRGRSLRTGCCGNHGQPGC
jgi:hypothetical protein